MKKKVLSFLLISIVFFFVTTTNQYIVSANSKVDFDTVSVGEHRAFAVKEDGSLWGWGYNDSLIVTHPDKVAGEMYLGKLYYPAPVKIADHVVSVAQGSMHVLVIKEDRSLWGWGDTREGQMGIGNTSEGNGSGVAVSMIKTPVKIMDDVIKIVADISYNYALKSDGTLWRWGTSDINEYYQKINGIGNVSPYLWHSSVPEKFMDDVIAIDSNNNSNYVIKKDNSLWGWGYTLLEKKLRERYDPIPIKIMDDVVQVSTSGYCTYVIKKDGSLWGWGSQTSGRLGNGAGGSFYMEGIDEPIKIMDDVISVSAGGSFCMAIKTDNSLWAWGSNHLGQLGDGNVDDLQSNWGIGFSDGDIYRHGYKNRPVKIMDDVVYVKAGDQSCMAVKTDGSLWA